MIFAILVHRSKGKSICNTLMRSTANGLLESYVTEVAEMIGAYVLNIAQQDYEPQGASVTILIMEDEADTKRLL